MVIALSGGEILYLEIDESHTLNEADAVWRGSVADGRFGTAAAWAGSATWVTTMELGRRRVVEVHRGLMSRLQEPVDQTSSEHRLPLRPICPLPSDFGVVSEAGDREASRSPELSDLWRVRRWRSET